MSRRLILWVLLIYLAVFPALGYALLTRSFDLMMTREYERALNEEALIADSAWTRLQSARYDQYAAIQESLRALYRADRANPLQLYYNGRPLGTPLVQEGLAARLLPDQGRLALLHSEGGARTLYISHWLSPRLALIYGSDVGELYAQRDGLLRLFLILLALGFLVTGLISLAFSNLSLRPVRQLTQAAAALARGEPAPPLAVQRGDEIGQLARSFDQMASAVQAREAALQREAQARQDLVDALAHEMRTPLTTILGFVRLLEEPTLPEAERAKALSRIADQTKRLATMDERLLTLTRMDHDSLKRDRFSLLDCLREAAQGMDGVEVGGEDQLIVADRELILMLAQNLIVNALRAGGEPPVRVLAEAPGFTVSDRGRGMSPEQLARACEPFYRADSARSRAQGGAGLGLTLASRIAQLHGGKLSIDSALGEGTRVQVDLSACYHSFTSL